MLLLVIMSNDQEKKENENNIKHLVLSGGVTN